MVDDSRMKVIWILLIRWMLPWVRVVTPCMRLWLVKREDHTIASNNWLRWDQIQWLHPFQGEWPQYIRWRMTRWVETGPWTKSLIWFPVRVKPLSLVTLSTVLIAMLNKGGSPMELPLLQGTWVRKVPQWLTSRNVEPNRLSRPISAPSLQFLCLGDIKLLFYGAKYLGTFEIRLFLYRQDGGFAASLYWADFMQTETYGKSSGQCQAFSPMVPEVITRYNSVVRPSDLR